MCFSVEFTVRRDAVALVVGGPTGMSCQSRSLFDRYVFLGQGNVFQVESSPSCLSVIAVLGMQVEPEDSTQTVVVRVVGVAAVTVGID